VKTAPHFYFHVLVLLSLPLTASAQVCTARALRLVDDAQVSAAAGREAEAAQSLERAADQCPNSCTVFFAISHAYDKMGKQQRAQKYLDYASQLGCSGLSASSIKAPKVTTDEPQSFGEERNSYVRQKWALVVGVDRFLHSEVPGLRLSAKDAQDFADVLVDPKIGRFPRQAVKLLLNENATVENIRTEINKIAISAMPDDLVVLYFSTHGSPAAMDAATDLGRTGYIVAYNTDVNNLYATAFPMDELQRVVDLRFKAGRVITFLDTCYSGDTMQHAASKGLFTGIPEDSLARVAQGKGRVVIASSRSNEQSWECEKYSNSCFTHQLLEAMRQKEGLATVSDIYKSIQLSVPAVVMREKHAPQNPVMRPEAGKINIVIGTPVE
jgi:hypothetical protein